MAVPTEYRSIVGTAAKAAGAIGVPGAFSFGLDVTAMAGIWAAMFMAIAKRSQLQIDTSLALKVGAGVAAGVAAYVGGSKLAFSMFHLIPGAGTVAAVGINSLLNFLFTYKVGAAMANLFETEQAGTSDEHKLIASLLGLVAVLPNWGDLGDAAQVIKETADNKTFRDLLAVVAGERA